MTITKEFRSLRMLRGALQIIYIVPVTIFQLQLGKAGHLISSDTNNSHSVAKNVLGDILLSQGLSSTVECLVGWLHGNEEKKLYKSIHGCSLKNLENQKGMKCEELFSVSNNRVVYMIAFTYMSVFYDHISIRHEMCKPYLYVLTHPQIFVWIIIYVNAHTYKLHKHICVCIYRYSM